MFHHAGAFVDEGGVKLHEIGSEADFSIGVLSGEDAAVADEDVLAVIHAGIQTADAAVDERLDGTTRDGSGLVGEAFPRCSELKRVRLAGGRLKQKPRTKGKASLSISTRSCSAGSSRGAIFRMTGQAIRIGARRSSSRVMLPGLGEEVLTAFGIWATEVQREISGVRMQQGDAAFVVGEDVVIAAWWCIGTIILETGMERDEDGVVLGSTRLSGSQRLHRKGDATREAGSLVGPMTAADSPSAISVSRIIGFDNVHTERVTRAMCGEACGDDLRTFVGQAVIDDDGAVSG